MANEIIKCVHVTATFPGGRVVKGFTSCPPIKTNEIFQIWLHDKKGESVLVNPSLSETVELSFEYEKQYG